MVAELETALTSALEMLKDSIGKLSDDDWRTGIDDYLVPVRIAYHIIVGLEWLVTDVPPKEHKETRRYNLNWLGPVDGMPSRAGMLQDAGWMGVRKTKRLKTRAQPGTESQNDVAKAKVAKAPHFLRHTQHHIGELGVIARLANVGATDWM